MAMPDGSGQSVCQGCRRVDPSVCERGFIPMMVMFCNGCWNVEANQLAISEGATDSAAPEPDPDDVTWFAEPVPPCEKCGEAIQRRLPNYDRWVHLELEQMTAKEIPPKHRWRLMPLRHGSCSSDVCAGKQLVRVGAGMGTATMIMNVC
ncbi:hypothetical protein, partial [Streptomyces sp. NPDC087437]|uniref:hypothetical protein n=1 Tax=Streptomyces sp. NPDC087437 TaxID=3365789 RepID=UPI0038116833